MFLLIVGIGLLIGLEWMREPVAVPDLTPISAIRPAVPAAFSQPIEAIDGAPTALASAPITDRREYPTTEPVATSGSVRYRAASRRELAPGETPDDYVAPRSTPGTVTTARSLAPGPMLSVVPTETAAPALFFDDETLKPELTSHR